MITGKIVPLPPNTIYDMMAVWLENKVQHYNGMRSCRIYKGNRIGIDIPNHKIVNWSDENDYLVLSVSGTITSSKLWVDVECQRTNMQITIQIQ